MGHIPVVLHNLLDDLVFLVVQNSGIKIPLDLVLEDRVFLSYAVKAIEGYGLKGASHHRVLLQHLVEMVHREGVQTTICVRSDAGCSSASSQQTDLSKVRPVRDLCLFAALRQDS